jgi:predicted MFS family arabinose efflux permease
VSDGPARATAYGWAVLAVSFALLLSDYMARQVLNAVFPLLKAEWGLTDGKLGLLAGVVPLAVGGLSLPLSIIADRWGRARSLALMALVWSLSTLLCAIAPGYNTMLAGRALVGVGEAAYGSVGLAVVVSVFPASLRATLTGAFMAGGLAGQVLGVGLGAEVAAGFGWRAAFAAIGCAGLGLAIVYPMVVREGRVRALAGPAPRPTRSLQLGRLFKGRALLLCYAGNGLALFCAGALPAWLPSYFNRAYHLPVASAGRLAAGLLLVCGIGTVLCGITADRLSRGNPRRAAALAALYACGVALALGLAMRLPPGPGQIALLAVAMALVAGTTGPSGALVAGLTPRAMHASAFAVTALANNALGMAPGPIITGRLADALGLAGAFSLLPVPSLLAALCFALIWRGKWPQAEPSAAPTTFD